MNELGNTPADKNYKPSGISKAEERAWEAYPYKNGMKGLICENSRGIYIQGYEQAEKDTIAIIKDYVEKGIRCMEQSDKFQMHTFWDGFHNCAENILRELEGKK